MAPADPWLLEFALLQEVADDYESIEVLSRSLETIKREHGLEYSHDSIVTALAGLCTRGLVQAYVLSASAPHATEVKFSNDRADDLWFYVTDKGLEVIKLFG